MRITIESTTKIVTVDGVEMRIWEGQTEAGIPMHAFVARVAVARQQDSAVFDRELMECRAPSAAIDAAYGIDPRFIL